MPLLLTIALLSAGKIDPSLVATWTLAGEPFLTLDANGGGSFEDGKVKWSVEGKTLIITDDEGVDRVPYSVAQDTLTLTMGGVPLQLKRAGKGVQVEKKGRLSKALEKRSEAEADAEAMADAERVLGQQGNVQVRAGKGGASVEVNAPQPKAAGNDQLSRLLTSSAWCWLKYASGNTYQERIVFSANGTWSSNRESEIYGSNQYAGTSAHSVGASGAGGQWAVKGGQLYMSSPPEEPSLSPVPLQVTRNSNGYPIITADGKEYSSCN